MRIALLFLLAFAPSCEFLSGGPGIIQEQAQEQLWNAIELAEPGVTEGLADEIAEPFRAAVAAHDMVEAKLTWGPVEFAASELIEQQLADGEIGPNVAESLREGIRKMNEAIGGLK